MTTPVPSITALPTAPDVADRSTFNARAYPWSAALPTFGTEVKAVADATFANATEVATNTSAAAGSASAAAASVATVGAVWVSGSTYAIGDMRYSPINFATYRRKTAGAGTTDPSADATNWAAAATTAPSGLVLLATLTPTAAANVDFLSTFSASYDNYLVVGEGIKPASDDALRMRFAVAGSADSGSNYFVRNSDDGSAMTAAATSANVSSNTVLAAGVGCNFNSNVLNANDATRLKSLQNYSSFQTNATPGFIINGGGSSYNAANAITGFRLYWNSGANFAATGTVRVYGYANT